ncbi:MAG: hypothetical protein Q8P67_11010 [archaeon]|nr:hypothetical protein [archaeon]
MSSIFQIACNGAIPPLHPIVSLLIKPDLNRSVKLLTYHLLKHCKSYQEVEIWDSVLQVIRRDIENRDLPDVQIAAIKAISAVPFKLLTQRFRSGDIQIWGRDPLQLRSSVRLSFLEVLSFQLQRNTEILLDPSLAVTGWSEVCRCLVDTSNRIVGLAFQTVGRQIGRCSGLQPELTVDVRMDTSVSLSNSIELITRFCSSNFLAIYRSFTKLHAHQRSSAIIHLAYILYVAIRTDPLLSPTKPLGLMDLVSIDIAQMAQTSTHFLLQLMHSLDPTTTFEAGKAIISLSHELHYFATVQDAVIPRFLALLALPTESLPLDFKLSVVAATTPLLALIKNPDLQFDALLTLFGHIRTIPVLQHRLRFLFAFLKNLIQMTLSHYETDLSSDPTSLPAAILIDKFMNDMRVRNLLTQPEIDHNREVPLFRQDFLVALLTCLSHTTNPPTSSPLDFLVDSLVPVPAAMSHHLLDVAVRIFIRTVPCIHWKFKESSIPIELYINLMSRLFEIFLHGRSSVKSSPALKTKFFSFIVGGIGSINFLREVPSFPLLLRLISLFATYAPLLISVTASGQKSLAMKANELPLKLLQLLESLTITSKPASQPSTSTAAPVSPPWAEVVLPLLDTISSLARDASSSTLALQFLEKLSKDPILTNSHRRLCTNLISQFDAFRQDAVPLAHTPRPSTHQVASRNSPRDLHYFLGVQLFKSGIEDYRSNASTSLTLQRKTLTYWTASGSSDPVLVEIASLANIQFQRLSVFLQISNTTNMKLVDLAIHLHTAGQLVNRSQDIYHIASLGFRQCVKIKFPLHVCGLINNAIQIGVTFRTAFADSEKSAIPDSPFLPCARYVPSLSSFIHPLPFSASEYTNIWPKLFPAFHLDAILSDSQSPRSFAQQLGIVTSFPCIYDDPADPKSSHRQSNIFGFAGISWFADQLAFVAMFNHNSSLNRWIVRIHARASNPKLFPIFEGFMRSRILNIPHTFFSLVEAGQQKEHFIFFETFLPFED